MQDILVIGSGIAGLAAARACHAAGRDVLVIDKGRVPGGRCATRKSRDGWQFDHGCAIVDGGAAVLAETVADARATGVLAAWGSIGAPLVGVPGMADWPAWLARDLSLRQGVEVSAISRIPGGWRAETEGGPIDAVRVALTVPAPQALRLIGPDHALTDAAASVEMAPILTLMAAFSPVPHPGFEVRRTPLDPQGSVIWDGGKPDRPHAGAWVHHAGAEASETYLEETKEAIAEALLPDLCDLLGVRRRDAVYVAGHRWRYAHARRPLGQPCLVDPSGTFAAGGDWCLGTSVAHAWESGEAVARSLLAA
ncbi:MAG: FAD-dependent oxidoreductase [Pseudomonadota bacterium]